MTAEEKTQYSFPTLVLDGGLVGTTLEDVFHRDISGPLWSAKPIEEDPEVIIEAHLAFLRAGADIILTSTYQCAHNTFERSGYSREDARHIMLKSVRLAMEAKHRFLEEQRDTKTSSQQLRSVMVALSLGPYGATLYPAQEFDGFYPPPFGPDLSRTSEKTNTFEDASKEQAAIEALTTFHFERLSVFADEPEVWDAVDFVAFETVPLRREITAIRRAVAELQTTKDLVPIGVPRNDGNRMMKRWWISTVHPDGRYPEMTVEGRRATTTEVAEAALLCENELPSPWGFGINCTSIEFLPGLLQEVKNVAKEVAVGWRKPWLVLYPNRGDLYEPKTQTWEKRNKEGAGWAEEMRTVVDEAGKAQVWAGVIAGGCCKTGPDEISCLAQELRNI
ncbi:Homocysteine S-methyltransferase [Lentinus tigrinus ALCF2SS1-7]|uniref:Homocysteine S-methyltransferase n=1 Tax=Lentinus tigrinus ALCF2SS1-7 TaxID=1328758 RepID=UPI0011663306|nr:Homocysteine S-methyltransferase [Lentinus tigrinus ALCF2SS1-7]